MCIVGNGYQCIGKGELDLKQLSRDTLDESLDKKGEVRSTSQV